MASPVIGGPDVEVTPWVADAFKVAAKATWRDLMASRWTAHARWAAALGVPPGSPAITDAIRLARALNAGSDEVARLVHRQADALPADVAPVFAGSAETRAEKSTRAVEWLQRLADGLVDVVPAETLLAWVRVVVFSPGVTERCRGAGTARSSALRWSHEVAALVDACPPEVPVETLPLLYAAGVSPHEYILAQPRPTAELLRVVAGLRGYRF